MHADFLYICRGPARRRTTKVISKFLLQISIQQTSIDHLPNRKITVQSVSSFSSNPNNRQSNLSNNMWSNIMIVHYPYEH